MDYTKRNIKAMLISALSAIVVASLIIVTVFCLTAYPYKVKELTLSADELYAINTYTKDNLSDVKPTMRADIFSVTKRNIKRPTTKLMGDEFTLPGTNQTVTFTSYPGFYHKHDISGEYSHYMKYMLLRQGMFLLEDHKNMSLNGTLNQDNLFKHPAADAQFGEVLGTDNAVEKTIILDTTYRSLHTTGLYLPAGELITIKVEGLKTGEKINIITNRQSGLGYSSGMPDDYFEATDRLVNEGKFDEVQISNQWKKLNTRLPYIQAKLPINTNKQYYFGNPFGGIIHIDVGNCYSSNLKITITGAVETPHYILGVTTPQYFETYLKNAPGRIGALDTENGILIGPADSFKNIDDVENIALLWHSFFAVNESFTGGPYNANNLVLFDPHVPAGAAVHLGGGVSSCPSSWFNGCLNYQDLKTKGTWGVLHEIGHGNGSAFGSIWGLGGSQEGEVRNNALTCLAYIKFLDIGSNHGATAEHGYVAHPYTSLNMTLNIKNRSDYNELGYFEALSTYTNLMHSFGFDKFYELLQSYKYSPAKTFSSNIRADFAYRCSLIYGQNFIYYFNNILKCNITNDMFTQEQIQNMKRLPEYIPIANYYAGEIDGVKTGGYNSIAFGAPFEMDLEKTMLSPKPFKIYRVDQPMHGKLIQKDGKYIYHTTDKYYPEDNFSFYVQQENGIYHTFTVHFRIDYSRVKVERYENIGTSNIQTAIDNSLTQSPTLVFYSKAPGVTSYSAKPQQGKILDVISFKFIPKFSGAQRFFLKCDDSTRLTFSEDGNTYETKIEVQGVLSNYNINKSFEVLLSKGKEYFFKIYSVNAGGTGYALVGTALDENTPKNIPSGQFISTDSSTENTKAFLEYSPPKQIYMISSKNNILSGNVASNKPEWEVIESPLSEGGETYKENQYDEDGNVIATLTKYKKEALIDGFASTIFHSKWTGGNYTKIPHVYSIDTKRIQPFNYYSIQTRNNVNSYIQSYELQISDDNISFKTVSKSDNLTYKNLKAMITFKEVNGRYLKLIVNKCSGGYFSVISELDAGITSSTEKIVPATSSKLFITKGYSNSSYKDEFQSGSIATSAKDEKLLIKFTGNKIALYATMGKGFGKATIKIDGRSFGEINLDSDVYKTKQLVFAKSELKEGVHMLELITSSTDKFNLGFIGLSYNGTLLNAPNVYVEWSLTVAIIIFVVLFTALAIFTLLLYLLPPFRKKVLPSSLIEKIDSRYYDNKKIKHDKVEIEKPKEAKEENFSKKISSGKTKKKK